MERTHLWQQEYLSRVNFFCEIETPLPFRQTQLHSEINTKKFDYLRALVLTSLY